MMKKEIFLFSLLFPSCITAKEDILSSWKSMSPETDFLEPPSCDTTFNEQKDIADKASNDLIEQGWETTDGHLIFTSGNAFGNNPESVYGFIWFHKVPLFQMSEIDAIMWLGCTPPDLEYFSFRSYMFSTALEPFPKRIESEIPIFASLGDSVNNLRFHTSGGSVSPNNLNKTGGLIISANIPTAQIITDTLISNGFPENSMNYDWMPSSILNMSSVPHTPFDGNMIQEAYQMLYRVSIFHNEEDGERYTNSAFPIRMFHPPSTIEKDLAPLPTQIEKGTGTNENEYENDLNSLTSETISFWENKQCHQTRQVQLYPIDIEGILNCIPNGINCGGDNRDAAYFSDYDASYTLQPEGNASFLMVTGVNHNVSGKATYANLVVESAPQDQGVFNVSCNGRVGVNSNVYEGTASIFAPDLENTNALYAFAVSRNCTALSLLAGDGELGCLDVTSDMVSETDPFRVVSRAYLEAATTTGPSYDELLWPLVTEFVC
jgi:hypothetical protein